MLINNSVDDMTNTDNKLDDEIIAVDSNEGNFTELSNLIKETNINETLKLNKDYKHDWIVIIVVLTLINP